MRMKTRHQNFKVVYQFICNLFLEFEMTYWSRSRGARNHPLFRLCVEGVYADEGVYLQLLWMNLQMQSVISLLPTPGEAKAKAMPGRPYIHTRNNK
jgi:hypothetical protein